MNTQYGKAYTNPYATGSSSDAQISNMLQSLQNMSSSAGGQPVAAPADTASTALKALSGSTALSTPTSQAASAAVPALASLLGGSGGAASASASGLSAIGGGGAGGGALGALGAGVGVLGGLADIYFGFQANKLAKKQFNFQKDAYNNNLQNTVQSYNTSLEDRIRARHNTESRSGSETTSYLNNNRLEAKTI